MSKYLTPVLVLVVAVLAITLVFKGGEVLTAYAGWTEWNVSEATANITGKIPTMKVTDCADTVTASTSAVSLQGGYQKFVRCYGEVNDENGGDDFNSSTIWGVFYTTAGSGTGNNPNSTAADTQDIYRNTSCQWAARINETAQNFECYFNVWYHAQNTSTTGAWAFQANTTDGVNDVNQLNADVTDVNLLRALSVPAVLAFGSLAPGATSAADVSHTITNYGNVAIDLDLNGTVLTRIGSGSGSATISVGNIKYNCTDSGQDYTANMTSLSTVSTGADTTCEINLAESTSTGTPTATTDDTYWKIQIPQGVEGNYEGTIWFIAQAH